MGFFYISAPYLQNKRDATIRQMREVVFRKNIASGQQITLERNKFKLANLDTLMFANDKILKLESGVESFLKKIDKQYLDIQENPNILAKWVVKSHDGEKDLAKYLQEFKWNDYKYPRSYPIPRLVETYEVKLSNIQNQLRNHTNRYNDIRAQITQTTQKEGNYYVKDLSDLLTEENHVKAGDFYYTKFVTTVVAIVHSSSIQQFLGHYETFTDNVIPHSARQTKVAEKDGLTVWQTIEKYDRLVNIFAVKLEEEKKMRRQEDEDREDNNKKKDKRDITPVQQFIEKAREKMKIVVKQFKFESGISEKKKKKKQSLEIELKKENKKLSEMCQNFFSEMYDLYIHAKILRLIIETNMRFGNDQTVFYVIDGVSGKEKNLQALLVDIFGDKENQGLYGTKDEIDDAEDFFPYIYVPALTL